MRRTVRERQLPESHPEEPYTNPELPSPKSGTTAMNISLGAIPRTVTRRKDFLGKAPQSPPGNSLLQCALYAQSAVRMLFIVEVRHPQGTPRGPQTTL